VRYRRSPLSTELWPRSLQLRAGNRLPNYLVDCNGRRVRLHDLTATPGVHILLARDAEALDSAAPSSWLHVHRLDSWPGTGVAIVRPDGYLGLSAASGDSSEVAAWLARVGSAVLQLGRAGDEVGNSQVRADLVLDAGQQQAETMAPIRPRASQGKHANAAVPQTLGWPTAPPRSISEIHRAVPNPRHVLPAGSPLAAVAESGFGTGLLADHRQARLGSLRGKPRRVLLINSWGHHAIHEVNWTAAS
jgi:hypothetical protein